MDHRRWRVLALLPVLLAVLLPAMGSAAPTHEPFTTPPAAGTTVPPHDPYILARIPLETPGDPERLGGLALDIVRVEPGRWIEIVTHAPEVDELRQKEFEVQILIPDMEAEYARGRKGDNFGPFHTYSETVAELDAVHAAYPQITAEKVSLGTSHEGREIWAIKVSDNPELQENEPEVLFDALHHAREVITVEVVLNTLNHLCRNYGTDPDVTFLVDHRQIWFVPIVNPDGFVYNETNWPAGGGMWRKNRSDNGGGSYGVDPNRNYPYQWGGVGSSGNPDSETYRGPSPASEPEVQALMGLIEAHQFVTHQSYHSYADLILIPWAYTSSHTEDDSLFRIIGNQMARDSGYDVGQAGELLYYCSGVTTDWAYGDTSEKPKVLSFTTEVGGSGFWPSASELGPLVQENLYSDLYLIQAAGCYPILEEWAARDSAGNERIDPGELAHLTVTLRNDSPLAEAQDVTVELRTDEAYVEMIDDASSLGQIGTEATVGNGSDPFSFRVSVDCPEWRRLHFTLEIAADGGEVYREYPLSFRVGQPTVIYANDFEDASDWIQDSSHTASGGAFERIDPNETPYQPGDDTTPDPGIYALVTGQNSNPGDQDVDGGISAISSPVLDLTVYPGAELSLMYFFGQRDEGDDPDWDFFRIDVSNDGGATYPVNLVSYGDETVSGVWRALEVDLDEHIALTDQVRIRVQASEGPAAGDLIEAGIDDVLIAAGTSSGPSPVDDLTICTAADGVALTWSPAAGAVGYVVYRDSSAGFTPGPEDSLAFSADTVLVDEDTVGRAYYAIRAVDAGGQKSEDSAQVGRFGKGLIQEP
jgi:hypothetical protein